MESDGENGWGSLAGQPSVKTDVPLVFCQEPDSGGRARETTTTTAGGCEATKQGRECLPRVRANKGRERERRAHTLRCPFAPGHRTRPALSVPAAWARASAAQSSAAAGQRAGESARLALPSAPMPLEALPLDGSRAGEAQRLATCLTSDASPLLSQRPRAAARLEASSAGRVVRRQDRRRLLWPV